MQTVDQSDFDALHAAHRSYLDGGAIKGQRLELHDVDLRGLTLAERNLSEAWLTGCNFSGMDLTGINFFYADLSGSNLEGALLRRADLGKSQLVEVSARRADFRGASLLRSWAAAADFRDADLSRTDLAYCNLTEADLRGASFEDADLDWTAIAGAVFAQDSWEVAFSGAEGVFVDLGVVWIDGPQGRHALDVAELASAAREHGARLAAHREPELPRVDHVWRWGPL